MAGLLCSAPDRLLATYEAEQRPVAALVMELAADLLEAAKCGEMRRGRKMHHLDIGGPGSSLAVEAPEHRHVASSGIAPDAPLFGASGRTRELFDLFSVPHRTLLEFEGSSDMSLPTRAGFPLHRIGPDATCSTGTTTSALPTIRCPETGSSCATTAMPAPSSPQEGPMR